ncbi:protein LEG1 homolog [Marmota flaviventris]|uniref:protein LEG1 homolog n=1 Tax=Marmota flaviventris TaxID=93162 RepID=UPI000FFF9739|nr:protein LEG1 homolog [Marmota flaviventris]
MTFLPSWVCVLVGSLSFSLAGDLNFLDMYPPLWKESPGQFSDYPVENGTYIINPWIFPERLGMYKILLNQTATYFEKFASGNEQNLLWGLALQHGWQYSSGRLADPSQRTDCGYESDHLCISVDSWWADLNYFLCVLPFLAAVDYGILGISSDQVRLQPPPMDQKRFCYDVSGCLLSFPEIMNKWSDFYKYVHSPSSTFEDILEYLWVAHVFTLNNIFNTFDDRYVYYSKQEAKFEKNWVNAVEYIGAARIPTTFIRVYESQKGLPPRILSKMDTASGISDFTALQNTVLSGLSVLGTVSKLTVDNEYFKVKFVRKECTGQEIMISRIDMNHL